jgi:hypothetical protein
MLSDILQDFEHLKEYKFLWREYMVGLGTLVYVHNSIEEHVIHFETKKLMLGFKGIHGNKGSITLKFKIFNSMVSFTNVHLFSGQKEVDKRSYALKKIE